MSRAIRVVTVFVVVSVVVHFAAVSAFAAVSFEREGETLTRFTIDCGTGKLSMRRHLWSNTTVLTESGKEVKLTDPFMYNAHVKTGDEHIGGYWSDPKLWDLWKIERLDVPERSDTDIVRIAAEQVGLRKEVTITVEKGRNIAYVFNHLSALEEVNLRVDQQCIYVGKPSSYKLYVDGAELTPEHGVSVPVHRWFMLHQPAADVSAALIFLDREVQDYPGSDNEKRPFGNMTFTITEKAQGTSVWWKKGTGNMAAGSSRTQQYIIMWGDGDLREKVEALSKQALAGELNAKVHVLP